MMDINVNAHSSICITVENKTLWFDPYLIDGKNVKRGDIVLFTHSHYDHFSLEDALKVIDKNTLVIAPLEMKELVKKLPIKEENIFLLYAYDTVMAKNLKISTVPSYNVNKKFHPKEKGYLGYIINTQSESAYVTGDSDLTEEAKSVKCDYLLLPIGGTYTMDYKEASKLTNVIKPKVVIPTHYGSIVGEKDLGEKFSKLVDKDVLVKIII